jgi:hypothetical protein
MDEGERPTNLENAMGQMTDRYWTPKAKAKPN